MAGSRRYKLLCPIARGLAPLGVALLGALFANEWMSQIGGLGLLVASGAIVVLGRAGAKGEVARGAVPMALLTAVFIGIYTFSDGQGVRSVDRPERFIAWSFFLGCVPFAITAAVIRGRDGLATLRRNGLRAIGGGVMATLGYGIALWAMARAPMASVASRSCTAATPTTVTTAAVSPTPCGTRMWERARVDADMTTKRMAAWVAMLG